MYDFDSPTPWPQDSPELPKNMSDTDRLCVALSQLVGFIISLTIGIFICWLFSGCATRKVIEEHHHYEADTLAVKAQVDHQLNSWHERMDSTWHQVLSQYTSQQQQSEQQHEVITETVTETVDSLGNKIRQEQRTISRDITRELQQQEQRLTRELETRIHSAIDSVNADWQQRLNVLQKHVLQNDSIRKETEIGNQKATPWYQRIGNILIVALLGFVLGFIVMFIYKYFKK